MVVSLAPELPLTLVCVLFTGIRKVMKDKEELFKRLVEGFKPVNCKTTKRNEKDKVVKGKKDKPDSKEREITSTKVCDLKQVSSAPDKQRTEPLPKDDGATGRGSGMVSVDKDKFDYMVNSKDGKEKEPSDRMVDYDALMRMLKEDDSIVEDIVSILMDKLKLQQETKKKKMSNWEKKKRKKELNKKYNDGAKREKEFYPLKHINRSFMSLANGVAESIKKKD